MTELNEAAPAPDAKPKKAKLTEEQKAANKAAKEQAKADAKAAKEADKPVPQAKDTKNGVTRPARGVTLLVWQTADFISAEKKAPAERAAVAEALSGKVEVGTIHTQYGRWRKYYGLVETKEQRQTRLDAAKTAKAEKVAAEKAAKKAVKEAADKEKADKAAAEKQAKADAKAVKDAEKAAKAAAKEPVASGEPVAAE